MTQRGRGEHRDRGGAQRKGAEGSRGGAWAEEDLRGGALGGGVCEQQGRGPSGKGWGAGTRARQEVAVVQKELVATMPLQLRLQDEVHELPVLRAVAVGDVGVVELPVCGRRRVSAAAFPAWTSHLQGPLNLPPCAREARQAPQTRLSGSRLKHRLDSSSAQDSG